MNSISKSINIVDSNLSVRDVYDVVQEIAVEDINSRLEEMVESADTYEDWALSVKDGTRLIKILNSKKRIIKSSFKFQLKQNFSNFKSIPKTRFDQNLTRDRHSLKLSGVDLAAEYQALEFIIVGCEASYSDFYELACQRLQHCVHRTHVSETENPVHVKRLCEAFQYSLDALNLDSKFQIAVYRLFAHFVTDNLVSTYEKIDQCLIKNNILPNLQIVAIEPENICLSTKEEEIRMDSLSEQDKPELENYNTPTIRAKTLEVVVPKDQDVPEITEVVAEPELQQTLKEESLLLKTIDHAANMDKGDWVEIIQKNDTKMAKLVWKADDCSLFIFVDNTGNRMRELNASQLNKELENGSINKVTTSSIASNNTHFSVVHPFRGR